MASGAQIVLSKLPIGDLATQYFADRDIFCAGRVEAVSIRVGCSPLIMDGELMYSFFFAVGFVVCCLLFVVCCVCLFDVCICVCVYVLRGVDAGVFSFDLCGFLCGVGVVFIG